MNADNLLKASEKAFRIFDIVEKNQLVVPGKTEKQLKDEIAKIAKETFNIKKFWHKKIVRAGKNTIYPYKHSPPDQIIQEDDIVFFDFGPVLDEWEADIGKTLVLGNNKTKLKLKKDVESAWYEGKCFYDQNKETITGAQFYNFTKRLAQKYGWEYPQAYCGHLIGQFPHEKRLGEDITNYIHPENHTLMSKKDKFGDERFWIYEIHFIDKKHEIGAFFEKILL